MAPHPSLPALPPLDAATRAWFDREIGELTHVAPEGARLAVLTGNYGAALSHLRTIDWDAAGVRLLDAHDGSANDDPSSSGLRDAVIGAIGTLGGLWKPVLDLVVAFGAVGVAAFERFRSKPSPAENVAMLFYELFSSATSDGPAVVLIGDISVPERSLVWHAALDFTKSSNDGSLLVLAAVDAPARFGIIDGKDPLEGWPGILVQVRNAVSSGRAKRVHVLPLTPERVGAWIGYSEPDLVARLVAVSGGDDELAALIWHRWVESGHVQRDDAGAWRMTPVNDPFDAEIFSVLAARLGTGRPADEASIDIASDALRIASLSGPFFVPAAVDAVLTQHRDDCRPGQVIELLRLLAGETGTVDDQPFLLHDFGSVEIGQLGRFERSRFVSRAMARFLAHRHLTVPAGRAQAEELLAWMTPLTGSSAALDDCCIALSRSLGKSAVARHYEDRNLAAAKSALLVARASLLLSAASLDFLHIDEALDVARLLTSWGHTDLALRVAERGVVAATAFGNDHQRAQATYQHGLALGRAGRRESFEVFDNMLTLTRRLLAKTPNDPELQREFALGHLEAGITRSRLEDVQTALTYLTKAAELHRRLHDRRPDNRTHLLELAISLSEVGGAHGKLGRLEAADEHLSAGIALHERLAALDAHDRTQGISQSVALEELASVQWRLGREDSALANDRRSVEILRHLIAAGPDDRYVHRSLATPLTRLGKKLHEQGKFDDALECLLEASRLLRSILDTDPGDQLVHITLAFVHNHIADLRTDLSGAESALDDLVRAVELQRQLVAAEPEERRYLEGLASSLISLGSAMRALADHPAAISALSEAVELRRRLADSEPTNPTVVVELARALIHLGVAANDAHDFERAAASFTAAVELLPRPAGSEANYDGWETERGRAEQWLAELATRQTAESTALADDRAT